MNKWIAEFDLEDGDTMPEHMELNYMGAKMDFHCRPMWIPCSERLPEIGKEVLLSEPNTIFIAEYHGSGDPEGLWLVEGYHHYLADVNGCAWMPLPDPWKGEQ